MIDATKYTRAGQMSDGSPGLEIDTATAYPAAIADLRKWAGKRIEMADAWEYLVARGMDQKAAINAAGAVAGALQLSADAAGRLPADAFDLALKPLADIDPARRADRAAALECARLWFTELLHAAQGGGAMAIRWIRAPEFKQ